MRKLLSSSAAAVLLMAMSGAAQATIIFTSGNHPQPNEENILFGAQPPGMTLTGTTNQSDTSVQFVSTQTLVASGVGQSHLAPPSGFITGSITFSIPGDGFLDYIFNPQVGGGADGGTGTITAVSNDMTSTQPITLGHGNNFWTITTSGGEFLTSVELAVDTGNYNQYQQPRVSGVCSTSDSTCTPALVPEPAALALLGSALMGFGAIRRRRKSM